MRLIKITNQPNHERYGELVLLDNDSTVLFDIVYDGNGYHNYPSRVHGDYTLAKSELATYGRKGVMDYMAHLKQHYSMQVVGE